MRPELREREPHRHVVQFYGQDSHLLVRNVSRYLGEGLTRGECAVVVATPAHRDAFTRQMEEDGMNPAKAVREKRLIFRDAEDTLAQFMLNGQPDRERFESTVGSLIRELRMSRGCAGVRAYGEMVDLLWNAGHSSAADRLERFWNKLLAAEGFRLFCAYQIDIFGKEFQVGVLDEVMCTHTHVLSAADDGSLETAVNRALDEVLGEKVHELKTLIKANFRPSWAVVPRAEATVLWLRNNLPEYADEILTRARQHYRGVAAAGSIH